AEPIPHRNASVAWPPHDSPRNRHRLLISFRRGRGSIQKAHRQRGETTMSRKMISRAAAMVAIGTIGTSTAAAQGWVFKMHGWPFAPKWGKAEVVGQGDSGVSKPNVND